MSESLDPGHDLFACRLIEDVVGFFVFMIAENYSTVSPHTRHGVPTRGSKYLAPSHGGYETAIAR